jgi:penicillin G amidase
MKAIVLAGCCCLLVSCTTTVAGSSDTIRLSGLKHRVEILRDRWGMPHIFAQNQDDLFFANGYINARDRLFQLDLWRRVGTGRLAEVLGPQHVGRDRTARLFRFRGNWHDEWASYSPDTWQVARAFTSGINAFIGSLAGKWPEEFRIAGYAPGYWAPEDITARIAGLSISRNLVSEIRYAQDVVRFGPAVLSRHITFDPPASLTPPAGVNLADVTYDVVRDFMVLLSGSPFSQGSNNWAVDGTKSATGKPLLAADPHRGLEIPSLRRTIHLVAPGWNVIGAGEPALPGIALGHNEQIAFGFTITGTDQQDLYVERLNPGNADEYWHNGSWRRMNVVRETITVKGKTAGESVELRYTVHGPVLYQDRFQRNAYALRWVGFEPGGAGYLAALAAARAKNWDEFRAALRRYKVPAENMVYADTSGNIGLAVAGLTPVRKAHTGLLPVAGTGEFEWAGYLPADQLPAVFNPPSHVVATANNDIRPPGYSHVLTYEWGAPYRAQRASELLAPARKFSVPDFERMQYDVVSIPARRFQAVLRRWRPPAGRLAEITDRVRRWDAAVAADSAEAIVFEIWFSQLGTALFGDALGVRTETELVLRRLESAADLSVLRATLESTLRVIERGLGSDMSRWRWASANRLLFRHPLGQEKYNRGPLPRAGDSYTLNASGGNGLQYGEGASYRQVLDLADWDRSTMTNAPGEVGNPGSRHYDDLLPDWQAGRYHPMLYTRKAIEAATTERIMLEPR